MLTIEPTATFLAIQSSHQRIEMHNRVLVAKKTDNKLFLFIGNTVELMLLHLLEALYHSLVNAEFGSTILAL